MKVLRYVVLFLIAAVAVTAQQVWVELPPLQEWEEFLYTGQYPDGPPKLCCGDEKQWGWVQDGDGLWKLGEIRFSAAGELLGGQGELTQAGTLSSAVVASIPVFAAPPTPNMTFVGQSSCIPGLEQFAVIVQNTGDSSATIRASDVMVQAKAQGGIEMATYTSVLRAIEEANQRSVFRYMGIALEIGGYALAALSAGDLIKIRERWKAAIPAVSAGLTLTRTFVNRERRDVALPNDVIPPIFTLLPGESVSYSIFGTSK